ncbi:DUF6126 family protein [Streptomyces phaeochromogenes]|uniref:DUF6126 family protein n=1 Tax=Streptomyces phaeochromogenes TaxID=1923 RepID=UPI002E2D19FA|nr:DUF6126 family protein [Streptomyces phaeochromogenes]
MGDRATERPEDKRGKGKEKDREAWIERGVAIRAGFYIFGTHLFAGFVWLLFYLGEHANK